MASSSSIIINDNSGFSAVDRRQKVAKPHRFATGQELINYLAGIVGGSLQAEIFLDIAAESLVQATGAVSAASVNSGDTVTINGTALTAVTGSAGNNQFDQSGTDGETGDSLASAINNSTTALISSLVNATSNGSGVVTLTANVRGVAGNAFTLASSNGTRLPVSAARLAGGAGGFSSNGATGYNYGAPVT